MAHVILFPIFDKSHLTDTSVASSLAPYSASDWVTLTLSTKSVYRPSFVRWTEKTLMDFNRYFVVRMVLSGSFPILKNITLGNAEENHEIWTLDISTIHFLLEGSIQK